jgi:hypothetical protein
VIVRIITLVDEYLETYGLSGTLSIAAMKAEYVLNLELESLLESKIVLWLLTTPTLIRRCLLTEDPYLITYEHKILTRCCPPRSNRQMAKLNVCDLRSLHTNHFC